MDLLFTKYDLSTTLDNHIKKLREHVNKLAEDYVLAASEDDLTAYLKQEYSIEAPVLGEAFIASSEEVDIDVTDDPLRGGRFLGHRILVKGMQIHIKVPYTGDGNLFWFQPSHFTLSPPRGIVTKEYLEFYIRGERLVGENVKRNLDSTLNEIKGYLKHIADACKAHNASLDQKIQEMLKIRKERLLSNRQTVASIGLPIQAQPDAPRTYAVPNVQRKPALKPPIVKEKAFVPEPALDEKEYEHILSIIRSMVSVIERSPKAFAHMGEEDLRSQFLVQLNGQYQGRATGETFNYQGKTDILIREGDRNVFIAECKIWKGEAELLKAIDQVLAYLHWRDTKAALLVFNRNKTFSDVLAKVPTAIQRHPNCKKLITRVGETEWRFLFSSKDDINRELQLAVLLFDVPKSSES
jgi:hypothetical protein